MSTASTSLQDRLDPNLRNEAQAIFDSLGIDISSAVRMFLRQVVVERGMPFRPCLDPFYNPANIAHLQKALDDVRAGRGIETHALIGDDE